MAVSIREVLSDQDAGTGNPLSVTTSSGTLPEDVILAFIAVEAAAADKLPNPPNLASWTQHTYSGTSASQGPIVKLWSRTGLTGANAISVTPTDTDTVYLVVYVLTGALQSSIVAASVANQMTGQTTTHNAPSVAAPGTGFYAATFVANGVDYTSVGGGLTQRAKITVTTDNAMISGSKDVTVGSIASSAAFSTTATENCSAAFFIGPNLIDKAGTDTLTLGITDTSALMKHVPKDVTDTLTLGITDTSAVSVPIAKNVSDTLTLGITEGVAQVVHIIPKAVTDTLTLGIADASVRHTVGPISGTRVSPALALPEEPIVGSLVLWFATTPGSSTVGVETSVDNGATWQAVSNGGSIPRLLRGTTTARSVLTRVTLARVAAEDPTPRVHRLEVHVFTNASAHELCPLGVFTLNDVAVSDTPSGLEIELSGADLSRRVSRNRWDKTYVVEPGTNYSDAIQDLITDRLPGTVFNFASTSRVTPRLFFGEQSSNDPWSDAQDMATMIGMELFFDARGVCTLRPEPNPDIDQSVYEFEDRSRPTMTALTRRVTDENTYNKVVVTGEGSGNEVPVRAVAIDDDPASPTYYLGPYGTVTLRITNSLVLTTEQAQDAADAALLRVKGATEAVELEAVPMPALEPGDVVTVTRGRSKVEGRFLIDNIQIPLGAESTMRAVGRRQRI